MFHAVRDWWRRGRGKVTARLFLFEFVVVMAGVLAAQALQNWVANRNAVTQMEEGRTRALGQLADSLAYAGAWQAAIPCLNARMEEVSRAASSARPIDVPLDRPSLPNFIQDELDSQSDLLLRQRHGDATADNMKAMRFDLQFANNAVDQIAHGWGRLSLLDPRFGTPSDADRAAVRAAAADIRAQLVGLRFALEHFAAVTRATGTKPFSRDGFRPAKTCAEIWSGRSVAVPK